MARLGVLAALGVATGVVVLLLLMRMPDQVAVRTFQVIDADGPHGLPAPGVEARPADPVGSTTRRLLVSFDSGGTCDGHGPSDERAVAEELRTTIAITVTYRPARDDLGACSGTISSVVVPLKAPVGPRRLVNATTGRTVRRR